MVRSRHWPGVTEVDGGGRVRDCGVRVGPGMWVSLIRESGIRDEYIHGDGGPSGQGT